MNTCLVTELKGNVENNDLLVYGVIDVDIDLTNRVGNFDNTIFSTSGVNPIEVLDYDTKEVLIAKGSVELGLSSAQWNSLIGKHIIYRIYSRYDTLRAFSIDGYGIGSDVVFKYNIKDLSYCSSLTTITSQEATAARKNIIIDGELSDIVNFKSASSITRLTIHSYEGHFNGRLDAFITNLASPTPTLLLPNLTNLNIKGDAFTLPEGYTKSQLAAKYQAAGVTTVSFE